jgi:hypothetical protein
MSVLMTTMTTLAAILRLPALTRAIVMARQFSNRWRSPSSAALPQYPLVLLVVPVQIGVRVRDPVVSPGQA